MSDFWLGFAAGAGTIMILVAAIVGMGMWILGGDDEETP